LCLATLRAQPEDFIVEEELGFEPSGAGQHVLLKVRKRDANTQWVARELAKLCRCRPMDVGYAGLKDRHAVATQWFSVPKSSLSPEEWPPVRTAEFDVLAAHSHGRKLPRGALAGNTFTIRVCDLSVSDEQLAERVRQIGERGVPNIFGPQRFGRDGSNLMRIPQGVHSAHVVSAGAGSAGAESAGRESAGRESAGRESAVAESAGTKSAQGLRALRPHEREFVLSAARSLIFNGVLTARVLDGSWERLKAGDLANLDGRGSVFAVDQVDDVLIERARQLEIHPTGPMWGTGLPPTRGDVLERETLIASQLSAAADLVRAARMEQERRSLRMAVRDLSWARQEDGAVVLRFRLTKGSFATTVLREIFEIAPSPTFA
jgi:tRNA pseudouridine13 synthase